MGNNIVPCAPEASDPCCAAAAEVAREIILGNVYMVTCAIDYEPSSLSMARTVDAEKIVDLAAHCDARAIEKLYNREATALNTRRAIERVGSQCGSGDYFIFFYSGRRANLPNSCSEDPEGQDAAFCFVDTHGNSSAHESWLPDSDFAKIVTSSVHPRTKILIMSDCCDFGNVADLGKGEWTGRQAVLISTCAKARATSGPECEQLFVDSIMLAVEQFKQCRKERYSVGALYDVTKRKNDEAVSSTQIITIQATYGTSIDKLAWPLIPSGPFWAGHVSKVHGGSNSQIMGRSQDQGQSLAALDKAGGVGDDGGPPEVPPQQPQPQLLLASHPAAMHRLGRSHDLKLEGPHSRCSINRNKGDKHDGDMFRGSLEKVKIGLPRKHVVEFKNDVDPLINQLQKEGVAQVTEPEHSVCVGTRASRCSSLVANRSEHGSEDEAAQIRDLTEKLKKLEEALLHRKVEDATTDAHPYIQDAKGYIQEVDTTRPLGNLGLRKTELLHSITAASDDDTPRRAAPLPHLLDPRLARDAAGKRLHPRRTSDELSVSAGKPSATKPVKISKHPAIVGEAVEGTSPTGMRNDADDDSTSARLQWGAGRPPSPRSRSQGTPMRTRTESSVAQPSSYNKHRSHSRGKERTWVRNFISELRSET